jgi:hypothetical protein
VPTRRRRLVAHFWAIGEFVRNNADYPDRDTLKKPWPITSSTATAPTAINDSSKLNVASSSPPDR